MNNIHDTVFTHFGDCNLDKDKFLDIQDTSCYCGGLKPRGGLWGSNESAGSYGWSRWVEDNEFEADLSMSFRFKLKNNARVLMVQGRELCSNGHINGNPVLMPTMYKSWKHIKEQYDAVYIEAGTNRDLYFIYYGWDCDAILILNIDVIVEVK